MADTSVPTESIATEPVSTEAVVALAEQWLERASELETRADRASMEQLGDLVSDEDGVRFVMGFVDRVARPDHASVAAHQLAGLVDANSGNSLPKFLSPLDRLMLRAGGWLAPKLPSIVMPIAKARMRSIVGHLVAPAETDALKAHLGRQRSGGYALNVNLLGEAVLGEREANARLDRLMEVLAVPDVDYVSVKVSAIASQINHWDFEASLDRVEARLGELVDAAAQTNPPTFVNFDMEEYHDLHLTVAAFKRVLSAPHRRGLDAGIVLQAYLPDVFDILVDLVNWANDRHHQHGGEVKIRLVKGANLAMEQVDAAMHGWEQAPFGSKLDVDASYRRCMEWVLTPERLAGVRIGVATHNLFDAAWAKLLADERGVSHRIQFEMLQGMAPGHARAVNESTASDDMLLYTPAVAADDFDVAIGYLFRRLEENAAPQNFMRKLFDLEPGSEAFAAEADFFRAGVARMPELDLSPRRTQNRSEPPQPAYRIGEPFRNEPDTDPSLETNRAWIAEVLAMGTSPCATPVTTERGELDAVLATSRDAAKRWTEVPAPERQAILHRVGDELAKRRGLLIATMMDEASKVISEGDVEVSEAIDFARWYGDRALDLVDPALGASFTPFGVVAVIPPWNFPTAIPAGGVLASLAAGNSVIFKPAPDTPRCAEIVAEACWAAGVPRDVLQFVRVPDNELGRHLVESVDAVILTGSSETADLFRSWKPSLRLFAETSGKNALIVTPNADLDLAAQDLARSAFGHAGQKCSAASLAILVGEVAQSDRFRRQLLDAAQSLTVGQPRHLGTDVAPLVGGINDRLSHGMANLEPGESWLLEPTSPEPATMTPGIRDGVQPGSWLHTTECFGPLLGLMEAPDLDTAIEIANSSAFGLTGGIFSLDPAEVAEWSERVEIGNGYVNRPITGAIVQRQPFGGWKRSSVGPGAKAGGVNYLMQLGSWQDKAGSEPTSEALDYAEVYQSHFAIEHDQTGLFCEANRFRYRPLPSIGFRIGPDADGESVARVREAARISGTELVVSEAVHTVGDHWIDEMINAGVVRVRVVGDDISDAVAAAANRAGIHLATAPVTASGRIELQHYHREQALSVTLHRFGNLIS